jgi:hypothetical protein
MRTVSTSSGEAPRTAATVNTGGEGENEEGVREGSRLWEGEERNSAIFIGRGSWGEKRNDGHGLIKGTIDGGRK